MPIKEWTTHLPTGLDSPSVDQPNLINDPPDGDVSRVSQIHTVRNIANYCANQIGSNVEETGTLRKRVSDLEAGGGSGTDPDAIHVNVPDEISTITNKTVPVDEDLIIIEDSEETLNKKRMFIGNLPIGSDRWKVHGQDTEYSVSSMTYVNVLTFRVTRDSGNPPIAWRAICGLWSTDSYSGRAQARIRVVGTGGTDQATIYTDMHTVAETIFAVTFSATDMACPQDTPLTVYVDLLDDASGDTAYIKFFELMAIVSTAGGRYGSGGGGG